jgi:thiol-disulfide isomerase/thioredoxin
MHTLTLSDLSQPSQAKRLDAMDRMVGNHDMLLLVHADWCGHCQHMKPAWEKMKKTLAKDTMTVVEINESVMSNMLERANQSPLCKIVSGNVRGFPFIAKLSKVESDRSIELLMFNGERSHDELVAFVKRNFMLKGKAADKKDKAKAAAAKKDSSDKASKKRSSTKESKNKK